MMSSSTDGVQEKKHYSQNRTKLNFAKQYEKEPDKYHIVWSEETKMNMEGGVHGGAAWDQKV